MANDLNTIRRAVKKIFNEAGYDFCIKTSDWSKKLTTINGSVTTRYKDGFVLSLGCDYTLPDEERHKLWDEHGRKIHTLLMDAGFSPDATIYGPNQYRTIVIKTPEKRK